MNTTATFSVAQIYGLISNIPFYGPATPLHTMPVAIYMTGQQPPYDEACEMDTSMFLDYMVWCKIIADSVTTPLLTQMMIQYPATIALPELAIGKPRKGLAVAEHVATLKREIAQRKIDLERRVPLSPLEAEEREQVYRQLRDDQYWVACAQAIHEEGRMSFHLS